MKAVYIAQTQHPAHWPWVGGFGGGGGGMFVHALLTHSRACVRDTPVTPEPTPRILALCVTVAAGAAGAPPGEEVAHVVEQPALRREAQKGDLL